MPVGILSSTSTVEGTPLPAPEEARWFVPGLAERGPVDEPVLIRSMRAFTDAFGDQTNYGVLYQQLAGFFATGGYEAYCARVVGTTPVKATISLDTGKWVVTAKEFGPYANGWTAAFAIGTPKILTVVADGKTYTYSGTTWAAIKALADADTDAPFVVTGSGVLPTSGVTATPLAGGTDDHGTATASDYVDALDLFDIDLGVGYVSIPGQSLEDVGEGLRAHCESVNWRREVLQAGARADTLTDVNGYADALADDDDHGNVIPLWPHLPTVLGVLSPEGVIAGHRAAVIRDKGVWFAPFGGQGALVYGSGAQFVTGVDQIATRAEIDAAHDLHGVNTIKLVKGVPTLYGWRTVSSDRANYRYGTAREVLNLTALRLEDRLAEYVGAPLSDNLIQLVKGSAEGVLKDLASAGAYYPLVVNKVRLDAGWSVKVEPVVDSGDGSAALQVSAKVRPTPATEAIYVPIAKIPLATPIAA